MIAISHRGNLTGRQPDLENSPNYILAAIDAGFDVEVDIHRLDGQLWLGHDGPEYKIDPHFLNDKLWCHAKSIDALDLLMDLGVHCFYHVGDAVTLTSKQFLWTLPGQLLTPRSICVLPELNDWDFTNCAGFCSDVVGIIKHDRR